MTDMQKSSKRVRSAGLKANNKLRSDTSLRLALCLLFTLFFPVGRAAAQEVRRGAIVIYEDGHDTSSPVREVLLGAPEARRGRPLPHRRPGPDRVDDTPDGVLQSKEGSEGGTTSRLNFGGIGATGFAPPDTNASVGATEVVETVNVSYEVFSKATGAPVFGPASIGSIWTGFPGVCGSGNLSDPVVLYDKAAGRWIIGIVAFDSTFTSNAECIAVSTTSDAAGSFNRYGFSFGVDLNDYTKLAVWPDAYYLSANIFPGGGAFAGPAACALDRTAMLAGTTATGQCFQLGTNDASLLPSDLDGSTAPPAGSPNFFLELGTSTTLNLFQFHVDFANSANSTFTGPITINVSPYSLACGGTGGTCIPQPGTSQQLDTLGDRLMFRLAYRNFASHESLVASHSITSGNSTAVRWYEIQNPNGTPTVFQSGTFAPNANSRWMPGIAMDKAGDIAVGYSISSSSVFPSIAHTGRVPTDPPGTLENETILLSGSGSQTGGLSRWGDYTSMAIDPSDDCTFWYANQYQPANGSFNWNTQLASFSFPSCASTAPDFTVSGSPTSQTVVQGNSTSYTVTVGAVNGFTGPVSFGASGLPSGAGASFNPTSVTGSGTSTMNVTASTSTPPGTYTITITGTSGSSSHTTTVSLTVNAAATPNFSLSASPTSVTVIQGNSGTSTITVTPQNGFTGTVNFNPPSGAPSGATGSLNPTSVTSGSGSSTLTITTSTSTAPGTYTITVTGVSGSLSHTTTVILTVNTAGQPDFSLSASPTSLDVPQASIGSSTITVNPTNGFNSSVTFSTSALPTGVTASFSPNPSNTTSTLTFMASDTATTGTFAVTVTGMSGNLTHSVTISLTVSPGGDN